MSRSGALICYYINDVGDPEIALEKVRNWLMADWVLIANQTKSESNLWERICRRLSGEEISLSEDSEIVCSRCDASALRGKYISGRKMTIDFNKSVLTDFFCQRHAELDVGVRGDFNPGTPIVTIGPHDIVTVNENEQFSLVGRAQFSVKVWGNGTPVQRRFYEDIDGGGVWATKFCTEFFGGLNNLFLACPGNFAASFDA